MPPTGWDLTFALTQRLRRFHEALRSVLADADSVGVREVNVPILETGHSARHQPDVPAGDNKDKKHHNKDLCLPTFEMVEAAYHDLMRQYVAQQGNTFAWSAFLNKLLQKLDLESLSEESKVSCWLLLSFHQKKRLTTIFSCS